MRLFLHTELRKLFQKKSFLKIPKENKINNTSSFSSLDDDNDESTARCFFVVFDFFLFLDASEFCGDLE